MPPRGTQAAAVAEGSGGRRSCVLRPARSARPSRRAAQRCCGCPLRADSGLDWFGSFRRSARIPGEGRNRHATSPEERERRSSPEIGRTAAPTRPISLRRARISRYLRLHSRFDLLRTCLFDYGSPSVGAWGRHGGATSRSTPRGRSGGCRRGRGSSRSRKARGPAAPGCWASPRAGAARGARSGASAAECEAPPPIARELSLHLGNRPRPRHPQPVRATRGALWSLIAHNSSAWGVSVWRVPRAAVRHSAAARRPRGPRAHPAQHPKRQKSSQFARSRQIRLAKKRFLRLGLFQRLLRGSTRG